jgi:hypothetical protein
VDHGREDVVYLHFHMLTINTLSIKLMLTVLGKKDLSPNMPLIKPSTKVKEKYEGAISNLIEDLQHHFLMHEVMTILNVVYSQF